MNYILQKDLSLPTRHIHVGVSKSLEEWKTILPEMNDEDFDIKTDWFIKDNKDFDDSMDWNDKDQELVFKVWKIKLEEVEPLYQILFFAFLLWKKGIFRNVEHMEERLLGCGVSLDDCPKVRGLYDKYLNKK